MAISKHNHNTSAASFKLQPAPGAPYVKLEELYKTNGPDHLYELCGLYINTKGRFGDQPVLWTHGVYVNLPEHMLRSCSDILQDQEAIDQINAGQAGFKIYEYQNKNGRTGYSVTFEDIQMPF